MKCDMGTLGGMSAVIAGGPAAGALMPLGCVLCHAWRFLVSAKIPANCNLEFTNDLFPFAASEAPQKEHVALKTVGLTTC